jgi:ferredoxin
MLEIRIDLDRCVGSQMCVHVDSTMFGLGPTGQAELIGAIDKDKGIEAADQCPMEAITVFEGGAVIAP